MSFFSWSDCIYVNMWFRSTGIQWGQMSVGKIIWWLLWYLLISREEETLIFETAWHHHTHAVGLSLSSAVQCFKIHKKVQFREFALFALLFWNQNLKNCWFLAFEIIVQPLVLNIQQVLQKHYLDQCGFWYHTVFVLFSINLELCGFWHFSEIFLNNTNFISVLLL